MCYKFSRILRTKRPEIDNQIKLLYSKTQKLDGTKKLIHDLWFSVRKWSVWLLVMRRWRHGILPRMFFRQWQPVGASPAGSLSWWRGPLSQTPSPSIATSSFSPTFSALTNNLEFGQVYSSHLLHNYQLCNYHIWWKMNKIKLIVKLQRFSWKEIESLESIRSRNPF